MIRFSCPQCQRAYELPNALTGLPLLCKGCGHRLAVPEPQPDPAPAPLAPVSAPPPPVPPPPNFARALPEPAAPPAAVATREPNPPAPTANGKYHPAPAAAEPHPPPAVEPPAPSPPPNPGSRFVPLIVDVAAGLALVGLGSFAGELVAKKSASQILSAAMTAPKFPPMDLLLWGSGPVLAGLLYLWLGTRGWTLGGWVRRRAG